LNINLKNYEDLEKMDAIESKSESEKQGIYNVIRRQFHAIYDFEPQCIIHIEAGYSWNITSNNFTKNSPLRIGLLPCARIISNIPCKFKGIHILDKTKYEWFYSKNPVQLLNGDYIIYKDYDLLPTKEKANELWENYWKTP
jgi:hypothetical protein